MKNLQILNKWWENGANRRATYLSLVAIIFVIPALVNGLGLLHVEPDGFVYGSLISISVGLFIIAVTLWFVDTLYESREKQDLIWQMRSTDNGLCLDAVHKLRERGWLTDGSLNGIDLSYANLENAKLENADLQNANLTRARLRKANLKNANLYGVNLNFANLNDARVTNANLQKTCFYEAR